jgi:hypothetical protein
MKKKLLVLLLTGLLLSVTNVFSQDPNFYIFLCFGQSNMVGGGTIEQQDQTVDSRFQVFQAVDCQNLGRYERNWYPATPPLCRCYNGLGPVDYFGRTMVENLPSNVKVGVITVAVEGCQIELFDKDEYQNNLIGAPDWLLSIVNNDYDGNPYQYLVDLANAAKNDGVIKGILLHQGESNYGDSQWPLKVKKVYDDMMNDIGLNPASVPLLAGQLAGGDASGMNSQIISTLPQVIPNAHIVSSNGCEVGEDGIHFTSVGYRELGRHYAAEMLSLLGGCSPTSITPYVQVNDGAWQQTSSVAIDAGSKVIFGPQPTSGGSWSWNGCGTSGSSREQTVYPTGSCTSTATYTNSSGCTSTQDFTVTVNGSSSYVSIQNKATGLMIDGMGRTSNGSVCSQQGNSGSENQQWTIETSGSYVRIKNRATGLYIDGMGSTSNGSVVDQWSDSNSDNQQWAQETTGSYVMFRNRATGLYLDGMGRTSDGSDLGQWQSSSSDNQQWILTGMKSTIMSDDAASVKESLAGSVAFPNPVTSVLNLQLTAPAKEIVVYSVEGKQVYSQNTASGNVEIDMSGFGPGIYFVKAIGQNETWTQKIMKQ